MAQQHSSKSAPLSPHTNHISVLAARPTPAKICGSESPPTHYTGSTNYTDTEWREVQAWGQVKETHEIHKLYDEQGRKTINRYEIVKEIGRGVHGKVKLARTMDSNELVALKILPRRKKPRLGRPETSEHEQTVRREIAILKKCVHPHVVRLREVIDDPASDKIYLVLEYMWGGEVIWRDDDDEPVLKLHQARSTFRDTMLGLEFLHYQGIIHRDIKPANLLWTKNHSVKISDFGVSHTSTSVECPTSALELAKTAGTPAFFAPELCWTMDSVKRPPITKAIDIWALGVTLFCLLCGRVPFEAHNEFELFQKITEQEVEIPSYLDEEAKDLLKRMLTKNPASRITIPEIKRHPFVTKGVKDPEQWMSDTNPGLFGQLEVNDQEVHEAVSSYESFKRRLTKIGNKLAGGLRRRTVAGDEKLDKTRPKDRLPSDNSSQNSSWKNFMRTSESTESSFSHSREKERDLTKSLHKSFDSCIRVDEQLHPGSRPIVMRRPSPREGDNLIRSHSPSFTKQTPIALHIARDGLESHSDIPQSHLTRSIGYANGLAAEKEKDGPKLPALSFDSVSDTESEEGCFIDFNKRRT